MPKRSLPKSPFMYISILGLWCYWAVTFDPRLFALLAQSQGFLSKLVVLVFIACLNVFWLLGSYYLMLALFTIVVAVSKRPRPTPLREFPEVAILYTTMQDFQEKAALSCVTQKYPNFHVFILDDSLDEASKACVDDFGRRHAEKATVIRRRDRKGFKAGSLNSALRHHVKDYPYFAVADADSVLPEDFISGLLPYFGMGDEVGYVQGSHRPNPEQKTHFARDLCLGIIPLWTVYYGPRNRFGNVIFLGHGGIVRYDVWEKVGGFPELVSEDLALSTRAAQLGYRGYFVPEVISYEDFPEGYRQIRRQQEKYVKGACEYLHREFLPFVRSPAVRWYEKIDVLLSCLSLFLPVVFLVFMLTYCVMIPQFFASWQPTTIELFGRQLQSVSVLALNQNFYDLWSRDFYATTIICTLAPALGCCALILRHPLRALKLLALSPVPYLSLMVVATEALVSYMATRKAVFLVTADRWGSDPGTWPRGFSPKSRLMRRVGSEDWSTKVAEIVVGGILLGMCLVTLNLCLLGFALATLLGPALLRARWESRLLRPFLYMPFFLICTGLALAGTDALLGQGSFMLVFAFHF